MTDLPTLTVTDGPARIAHVRLNRPDKLNSLTLGVLDELVAITRRIRADRTIRAVVISGEGRAFSAGLDFASAMAKPPALVASFLPRPWRGTNQFQEACWGFRRLPVPVIAAVHGHCFGGGLQLAMAADWRITTADAQWSILEAKWGLIPDMSGMQTLKQQLPADLLKRLTMTGEVFDGAAAVDHGLASEISEDPVADAETLAELVATRSPDSVAYAKKLVDETWTRGPRATFWLERARQFRLLVAKNTQVAQKAAAKKAAPVFRGRSVR
ncbi:MAG: crotonase/enoyl-CoA hydratase family protein [Corynebacterium sp.]|uniref:crotonase/enoyl-CoA hydratase family protein n=1 Tax=unclassified Corynebacterium TaxID=2624378 RepID=UPI002647820D|nr:crotonase/enoyl-CoA hydratase family protein [Corynebacterium sp.]MDN5581369.1 crotonase/enoyl-CoA hydratase family protein [Corynebacterium sp.]MDN5718643.1 crotonase/enoyl-CoA hydratase family protein [Corynebacterium sp.]MDN6323934.1 crotonase/enoyl-CoA hydratase family protein [Corynebacterium sp.]MDN6509378.1 crotonase/enoyl-CoA hydratase family protein [Corynebacterium sp.]